jgi:hypothetical protein
MDTKDIFDRIETVRYREHGTKVRTVNMDGDIDYRACIAEALK